MDDKTRTELGDIAVDLKTHGRRHLFSQRRYI